MSRCILKIKDKYFEWSTVVDAPLSYGMNYLELKKYIKAKYGLEGLKRLPNQLERIAKKGNSFQMTGDIKWLIAGNRAGDDETELNSDEIYEKYCSPVVVKKERTRIKKWCRICQKKFDPGERNKKRPTMCLKCYNESVMRRVEARRGLKDRRGWIVFEK